MLLFSDLAVGMEPMRQTEAQNTLRKALRIALDELCSSPPFLRSLLLIENKIERTVNVALSADAANLILVSVANAAASLDIAVKLTVDSYKKNNGIVFTNTKLAFVDLHSQQELSEYSDLGDALVDKANDTAFRTAVTASYKRIADRILNMHSNFMEFVCSLALQAMRKGITEPNKIHQYIIEQYNSIYPPTKSSYNNSFTKFYSDFNRSMLELLGSKDFLHTLEVIPVRAYGNNLLVELTKDSFHYINRILDKLCSDYNFTYSLVTNEADVFDEYVVCKATLSLSSEHGEFLRIEDIGEDLSVRKTPSRTAATRAMKRAVFRLAALANANLSKISNYVNTIYASQNDVVKAKVQSKMKELYGDKLSQMLSDVNTARRAQQLAAFHVAIDNILNRNNGSSKTQ